MNLVKQTRFILYDVDENKIRHYTKYIIWK